MIATGLRRPELLALRWTDFDADAGTISVTGKVIREKARGLVRVDETKTAAGLRVIPLPAFAIAALTERRTLPYLGQQSVIFPSTNGTLRDPDNFAGQWRRIRDELGVPDISSHSFRKTVATLIDDAGLSARIGADHLWARQSVDDPGPLHDPRTHPQPGLGTTRPGRYRQLGSAINDDRHY
ncbi:site-specific integrase [Mycolicibacterium helvum]|uniref:Tyr recombinase domain-containing protein n=1 Tax=Mycolicibacterium helvum TaxID=1534349 RepID=A0A7I7T0W1_9MYCO|nr:site-specific integrase [Mycolicibacterium helvum]BBY62099.1 hypothetical protein MHEL_03420 [Mycolicibacterium helvum]